MLSVSSIERSLDNRIYESNPQNANFYYLPFSSNERLIDTEKLYCINDDIMFRLVNGLSVYV